MQWEHCLSLSGPAKCAFIARTQLCLSPPHPDTQNKHCRERLPALQVRTQMRALWRGDI